jgi:hypothetical protein
MKQVRIHENTFLNIYIHKVAVGLDEMFEISDQPSDFNALMKQAAIDLIDSMNGNECDLLLMSIKDECEKRLNNKQS